MPESSWVRVCADGEPAEGERKLVKVVDEGVMLVRLEGKVFAVGHECPHYQCKLEEGALLGATIVCRCHDARFDVRTGKMTSPPALNDLPVYPVRAEDGSIWLGPAVKPVFPRKSGSDARTFLILGAGAAGNAAAETLRRAGFAGRIVMATAEEDQPYDRPNLSKEFLAGKAKPEWMPLRSPGFYKENGIEVLVAHRALSLDPGKKQVTFEGGEVLSFDKALLATGGTPRRLSIPGAADDCCFTLRSFSDAKAISLEAERAKSAAIIGAGFIAMELASSFRERGLEVTVIAPEAMPLARILGDRISAYLKKRHEENGVAFILGKTVTRISGQRGAKTLHLSDGSRIEAGFVVVGIGIQPSIEYLAKTDLVQGGGVRVDAGLRTKYPDLYAAGDIAITGEDGGRRIEHWVVAERQGRHAALSMLGSDGSYDEVPFFWTRQTGISVKYAGYAREWDAVSYRGEVESGKFLAGYYGKGSLRAAASVGMPNDLTAVEEILRKGIALPPDLLEDPRVDLLALARG